MIEDSLSRRPERTDVNTQKRPEEQRGSKSQTTASLRTASVCPKEHGGGALSQASVWPAEGLRNYSSSSLVTGQWKKRIPYNCHSFDNS